MAGRLSALDGQLSQQAEEVAARIESEKSAGARSLACYERRRGRFWSLKCRYEKLRALHPAAPVAADDF